MKITRNVITVSDLYQWLNSNVLVINREYQRGSGLWPLSARSFFIDTILNGFPFPKITIRQIINTKSIGATREVVDGQQRLMTIKDFIDDKFRLSSVSKKFGGKKYSELDPDLQEMFLAYEVSADIITVGTNDEVLEIFRRMNSYMLKLTDPEKRHATYQGRFKWFVLELLEAYTPFFEKTGILSIKKIGRMEDADLVTELCQVVLVGIENRAPSKLEKLYKDNNVSSDKFEEEDNCYKIVTTTLDFMKNDMGELFLNEQVPAYFVYSIFSALVFNKYGIKNVNSRNGISISTETTGEFATDTIIATRKINEMLKEVSDRNEDGMYGEFVKACMASTHRIQNRRIRLEWLVKALQSKH